MQVIHSGAPPRRGFVTLGGVPVKPCGLYGLGTDNMLDVTTSKISTPRVDLQSYFCYRRYYYFRIFVFVCSFFLDYLGSRPLYASTFPVFLVKVFTCQRERRGQGGGGGAGLSLARHADARIKAWRVAHVHDAACRGKPSETSVVSGTCRKYCPAAAVS